MAGEGAELQYGGAVMRERRGEEDMPVRFVRRRTYVARNDCDEITQIGNVLWLLLGGGFIMTIIYAALALAFTCSIILFPFGVQMFKMCQLALFPFGKSIKPTRLPLDEINRPITTHPSFMLFANILWLPIGLALGIVHMVFACIAACTIIGAPIGIQHLKLAQLVICPFGYEVIDGVHVTEETITTSTMDGLAHVHMHEGSIPIAEEVDEPLLTKPTAVTSG